MTAPAFVGNGQVYIVIIRAGKTGQMSNSLLLSTAERFHLFRSDAVSISEGAPHMMIIKRFSYWLSAPRLAWRVVEDITNIQ